jgi:4-alpha-glucanotransferase
MPDAWGIEESYIDATGTPQQVDERTVARLRHLIGSPEDGTAHDGTLRDGTHHDGTLHDNMDPLVTRTGESPRTGPGEVILEDGASVPVDDVLPGDLPLGYHTFAAADGSRRRLVVAPQRCHLPADWRTWGWAAQLYATRSRRSWGMGDLADLATLGRWSRRRRAGFVLVNPLGAVAPAGPQQPSPYFPTSRRFRSPLYLRVEDVPGADRVPDEIERAAMAGRGLNHDRDIDRDEVWRIKRAALEAVWRAGGDWVDFERWYAEQPAALGRFAAWSVLAERHGPEWPDWPADCRHPDGAGVRAAEADSADRVRFFAWLQWLLDRQLAAASRDIAVIQDLPIGFDPGGFDAWEWQDLLALEAAVGAPADEFNSLGQEWGIPPFVPWKLRAAGYQPFIETIRANMAVGGGLRVDHVMGLFRLWWVIRGSRPADGAYVRYPADDLLAIVALESHRAGAVVVGEDLGTVEGHVRHALFHHDILSYKLLWFEHDDPATWPPKAMAAVTTHDLPTVAGLWDGTDLDAQKRLGLQPNEESTAALRGRLVADGQVDRDADPAEAVVAAYRLLARSPAVLLSATLEDATVESERPNIPGSDDDRTNWSLALPVTLEALEEHPTAARISDVLAETTGRSGDAQEGAAGNAGNT